MNETFNVSFELPKSALIETPNSKVRDIKITIYYENPKAYGYPEVSYWSDEYSFTTEAIDNMRRIINEHYDRERL